MSGRTVSFDPGQPSHVVDDETAGAFMGALFDKAPGVFGWALAVALTGVEPSLPPRLRRAAPDQVEAHGGELRPVG